MNSFSVAELDLRISFPPTEVNDYEWIKGNLRQFDANLFAGSESNETETTIAVHEGVSIGGTVSYLRLGWVHLESLWVEPSFRRLGVATLLLDRLERLASERQVHGIRVTTTSGHFAEELYLRRGYEVDARWPLALSTTTIDEIALSKRFTE